MSSDEEKLIYASYECNVVDIHKLHLEKSKFNCMYKSKNLSHIGKKFLDGISEDATPLIIALSSYLYIGQSVIPIENLLNTVELLLMKGADPSLIDKHSNNSLYYALKIFEECSAKDQSLIIKMIKDIVNHMKKYDLHQVMGNGLIPIEYATLIEVEKANQLHRIFSDKGSSFSDVLKKMKINRSEDTHYTSKFEVTNALLNKGSVNLINSSLLNNVILGLVDYDKYTQDILLLLAKGLKFGKNEKELVRIGEYADKLFGNGRELNFFVRSGIEFEGFFQNFEDDQDLVYGLRELKKCAKSKKEKLAFVSWIKHGFASMKVSELDEDSIKTLIEACVSAKEDDFVLSILDKLLNNPDYQKSSNSKFYVKYEDDEPSSYLKKTSIDNGRSFGYM